MSELIILTAGVNLESSIGEQLLTSQEHHHLGTNSEEANKKLEKFINKRNAKQVIVVLLIKESRHNFNTWYDFLKKFRLSHPSTFIVCVHQHPHDAHDDANLRLDLFNVGASMVTSTKEAIDQALELVVKTHSSKGPYPCVYCNLPLNEDDLWFHNAFYHVNERNLKPIRCPICSIVCTPKKEPFPVHLRNAHGPCARGEIPSEYDHDPDKLYAFSLIVCVRQKEGKNQMLLVQEFASSGFWLPGGRVDEGETLENAARRECKEEAGCNIELTGVLQFQYTPSKKGVVRLRVVFYATAVDPESSLKSIPDFESCGATWVDFDSIQDLYQCRRLRGSEPYHWANYLRNGGAIHPLSIIEQ